MVIIGSRVTLDGRGADLIVNLAQRLEEPLGPLGRWAFLAGAWGAVFSSLLGVWQAIPYLFADFCRNMRIPEPGTTPQAQPRPSLTGSRAYKVFLFALATVPMSGLFFSFKEIQKAYAIVGACFMPMLALALLLLNGSPRLVGRRYRNRLPTTVILLGTLAFFCWILWRTVAGA